MRARTAAAAMACLAVLTAGCRVSDLSFRADKRIEIVAPADRSTVTLPFQLRWTVEDFDVVGPDGTNRNDAGYFAVLLDTTPMPPGEGLDYFARDDQSCLRSPGCPDATYLSDRDVYLTGGTTFEVQTLRDTRPIDRRSAPDDHEITVVLLNGRSERIGESAFKVDITVDRD
ncbi:MAG TPA: hypothetical protein VFA34_08975 [Actinomycetota bacterium]|nr:hypothetical protein [Actinomycetota bacterium]